MRHTAASRPSAEAPGQGVDRRHGRRESTRSGHLPFGRRLHSSARAFIESRELGCPGYIDSTGKTIIPLCFEGAWFSLTFTTCGVSMVTNEEGTMSTMRKELCRLDR